MRITVMTASLLIPMLLPLAGALQESGVPAPAPARSLEEVRVELDDVSVRALCTDAPRQVLLIGGPGESASAWRPVLERLPAWVGACAYERTRDPVEARGWYELMDELRRTHLALGYDAPYVLAAHGIAGMYARLYAADRPGDVAGLVLLDPAHEDLPELVSPAMPRADWEVWLAARDRMNADGVRESRLAEHARRVRPPRVPVTVVTALGSRGAPDGWDLRFMRQASRRVHASILMGVDGGRHVPAHRAGPEVHIDDPALAAEEIARVVRMSVPR